MTEVLMWSYVVASLAMIVGIGLTIRLYTTDGFDVSEGRLGILSLITGVAAVTYFAMAVEQGLFAAVGIGSFGVTASLPSSGYSAAIVRQVDWLVTTIAMVVYTGIIAEVENKYLLRASAADAVLVLFGAVGIVLQPPLRYGLYAVAGVGFFVVMYHLFIVYPREAAAMSPRRQRLFTRLQTHVGFMWLLYPIVWMASPLGFGVVAGVTAPILFVYLDVITKVPFPYFVWSNKMVFMGQEREELASDELLASPAEISGLLSRE